MFLPGPTKIFERPHLTCLTHGFTCSQALAPDLKKKVDNIRAQRASSEEMRKKLAVSKRLLFDPRNNG